MLKKHMAACLVASAFITMPVLAQTSTSPGATSPSATQPATGGSGAATAGGKFITEQQQNQWRASRLIGIDVYGADNNKIGDINEVLVDRQGNADAVVVGVGGFLGIGEKNVALPFNAFEWQMDDSRRTAAAGGTGAGTGAGSGAGAGRTAGADTTAAGGPAGAGAAGPGTAGTAGTTASTGAAGTGTTATTGAGTGAAGSPASTASTGAAGGSGSARSSAERGYPDHAVLRMSKADLENAPTFRYVGESRDASGSGGAARTGTGTSGTGTGAPGTAPRQ
jgi:hypothetical protein